MVKGKFAQPSKILKISLTWLFYTHPLSYTNNSLLIFCSSIYIYKSTTCNSRFFFTCCTTCYRRSANTTYRTPRSMWINATKLLLVCILFLLFSYNFEFLLDLLYFPREVFDIMYEDLLFGFYSLPFKFSGKVLPVIFIILFFSFILYMPTRLFLSSANKKSLK